MFLTSLLVYTFFNTAIIGAEINKNTIEEEVNIEDYPYIVSVRYFDNHICGGAILNQETVITSAQCIFDLNSLYTSIRIGSNEHKNGEKYEIKKILKHPAYNRQINEYDYALLKLSSKIIFNNRIKPIALTLPGEVIAEDTKTDFVGWVIDRNHSVMPKLRKLDISMIPFMDCIKKYGVNMIKFDIMFCAEAKKTEICLGDFGGPFVSSGKLIGIASWNYECEKAEFPGVYAKIQSVHDWIINN